METRLNVCFICNEYPPAAHGGIGTFTRTLGRALVKAGHTVRVVGPQQGENALLYEEDDGVSVFRLPRSSGRLKWFSDRRSVYHTVARWVRSGEVDVIELPDYLGFAAYWPRFEVPLVTRLHGSSTYYAAELGAKPDRLTFIAERASLRRADCFCSTSRYTAEKTRAIFRLGQVNIPVLYNTVPTASSVHVNRSRHRVIFSGTLAYKKGILSLMRAWPLVIGRIPSAELHVYGKDYPTQSGGSMQDYALSLVPASLQNTVLFHGHVASSTVREALRTARLAIFPSYTEAFALAPMEAMAEGCPTIYTSRSSGAELITDGINGLLVDPDKPDDIARAVVRLLTDDQLADRLGSAGKQRILRDFAWDSIVRENQLFYEHCISSFRQPHSTLDPCARTKHAGKTQACLDLVYTMSSTKSFEAPNLAQPLQTMRLLIVSHVVHYHWDSTFYAYGPYAREIEIWAEIFEAITIAAPCRNEPPPADAQPIDRSNVSVAPQTEAGGTTWRSKLRLFFAIPSMVFGLTKEMAKADAIHVRCPGNLGLLGAVLAPLFSKRLIAKYAGQWDTYPGEALTYRIQRAILGSSWWQGPVTVYGVWPRQSRHVVSFFTSVLTAAQIARAREIVQTRFIRTPITVTYSGRLTKPKNVDVLIRAIAQLESEAVAVKGLIIGDGPERQALETLAQTLGVANRIQFTGAISADQVVNRLELSDVFVLVSETEGWPKALTEAMTFGLLCIGSDRGLIPQFLSERRGFVVPPGDSAALSSVLREIARRPEAYESMGRAASKWASAYSIEMLRDALCDLMTKSWRLSNARDFEASSAPASL